MNQQTRVGPEFYDTQGYLANIRVYSETETERFQNAFAELEERIGRETCQIGVLDWHFKEEFIWRMATHPAVIDAVAWTLGPDLLLLATHFFCKYPEPEQKKFVAWHQDVTYWGLEPPEAHSAWIALDDVEKENGCMQVIPGSHRNGILPHGKSGANGNLLSVNQMVPAEFVEEDRAVFLEMKAGEMSIHHGMLLHSSAPNISNRRRCGLTVRFIAPHVRQAEVASTGKKNRPILIRGVYRHSHFETAQPPFSLSDPV